MRAHPQANLEELGGWLLANPVSSKNPECDSFTMELDFSGLSGTYQYVRGKAPSYLVVDRNDSTPIAAGGDGMVMIYDVLQGKVFYLRGQYIGMKARAHYSPKPNQSFLDLKGCMHAEPGDVQANLEITSEVPVGKIPDLTYRIEPLKGEEFLAQSTLRRGDRLVEMKVCFLGNPKPSKMKSLVISAPTGSSSPGDFVNTLRISGMNLTKTAPPGSFPDRQLQGIAEVLGAVEMGNEISRGFFEKSARIRRLIQDPSPESEKSLKILIAETRRCLLEAREKIQATYEAPVFLQTAFSNLPDDMIRRLYQLKGESGKSEQEFLGQFRGDELRKLLDNPEFRKQLAQDYILLTSSMAKESANPKQANLPASWADAFKQIDDQLKNLDASNLRASDLRLSAELRKVFKEFASHMERVGPDAP